MSEELNTLTNKLNCSKGEAVRKAVKLLVILCSADSVKIVTNGEVREVVL